MTTLDTLTDLGYGTVAIDELKKLRTIQRKYDKVVLENKMLMQLNTYGKIYINYSSSDCDGGHSGGSLTFNSIDKLYEWEEDKAEWADGPFGWELTKPTDVQEEYLYFTR